jgi:hypothetical protein
MPPALVAWLLAKALPSMENVGVKDPFCPRRSAPPAPPVAPAVLPVNVELVMLSVRPDDALAPVV